MINNKINLFLENNEALKNVKGSWANYSIITKSNALVSAMRNQKIETYRVNEALEIIKKETSMFSYFRGLNKLTTAITISFEDNMEENLKEIISIYNKLKDKFFKNEYLVIAAQVIFNSRNRIDVDDAVERTREAYDYMKKHHRFLTGHEDIGNAAIIATTSDNLEETFNEIEECYKYLKNYGLSSSNNIQSLSHILSLINMDSKQKCDNVFKMDSILRENKAALKGYNIPMLGIIAFISDNKQGIAQNISEVSSVLKKESGFGNFTLGANNRNMISAALVAADYIDSMDDNIKESLINNTNNIALTIAIAVQTAVMVSSAAATSAAASASS